MYKETQAERKIYKKGLAERKRCIKRDRQRGKDVPGVTGREEDNSLAERGRCIKRDRQRGRYVPGVTGREEDIQEETCREEEMCKERQAERNRCTRRDRQRG